MASHSDLSRVRQEFAVSLRENWKMFAFEGVALVLLGAAAILLPQVATFAIDVVVGWLLLFTGAVGLVATFRTRPSPGFWWSLLSAILSIVAGALFLSSPLRGALSLTFVLIAFFIIEGIASILFAFEHRRELPTGWIMMVVSGVVDLFLGGVIFLGLPGSAAWALGLLLGINLIFGGFALLAMAMQARSLSH